VAARAHAAAPPARASRAVGAAGLLLVAGHVAGLLGPLGDYTFLVLGLASFVAIELGLRRYRPALTWPWRVYSVAVVLFLAGGGVRQAVGSFGDLTSHRSLVPDLIVLPGYGLVTLAIAGMVRARWRGRGRDIDAMLDSSVAALAALTLAWVYLMTPALFHQDIPLRVRLSIVVYPPLSVFMLAMSSRVAFTAGRRMVASQRLLVGALTLFVIGDVVQTIGDAHLVSVPQRLIDLPYALAFLAFAVDCLHPSMVELTEPVPSDEAAPSRGRLALVAVALGIPALVSLTRTDADGAERVVLIAMVLALTVLAVTRMFRALREHARSEARFAHQATHDLLTGLPNRAYLLEHLERVLARAGAEDIRVGVVFLDVDRFKLVNDTGGHGLGDELLVAIARRLRIDVSPADLVARIGGDEFIVVLGAVDGLPAAIAAAERLRLSFELPFTLRGNDIYASASLGVTFTDGRDGASSGESLIRDADTAMYQAKEAGRDGVAVFDASMRDRVAERLLLEQDLRLALDADQLQVHFQPIVSLHDEQPTGFEALIRWAHPTRGMVPPATFIPIAEDTGLIVELGAWVLGEAARQVAEWRLTLPGAADLSVAVNLSARQLRDPRLLARVADVLDRSGLPGSALCLELTESLLMEDPQVAAATLRELRGLGVRLSVDDFGTGYSSLSYLKRFPVDHVKIDRSFVEGLDGHDSSEESLVAAIIAMAGALGMTTVAEGVESPAQAGRLRDLGADRAQGYLFSRPLSPTLVPTTLARLTARRYAATVAEGA
jgi:diguanylate cyclase (GGDEF)-like protein